MLRRKYLATPSILDVLTAERTRARNSSLRMVTEWAAVGFHQHNPNGGDGGCTYHITSFQAHIIYRAPKRLVPQEYGEGQQDQEQHCRLTVGAKAASRTVATNLSSKSTVSEPRRLTHMRDRNSRYLYLGRMSYYGLGWDFWKAKAIFKRFSGDSLFGFCEDGDPDDDEVEVEVLE